MASKKIQIHAMQSNASFTPVPADSSFTVDQLYDWHRIYSADVPAFVFGDEKKKSKFITWKALGQAIAVGTEFIRDRIVGIKEDNPDPMVIGILSAADTIVYTTFLYAFLKLTHSITGRPVLPLLISARNSPPAVAHLLSSTGAKYLWTSEGAMTALANEALAQMNDDSERPLTLLFPSADDLYHSEHVPSLEDKNDETVVDLDKPALILHSSGTTAFPKLVVVTHRTLNEWSRTPEPGSIRLPGKTMAVHSMPLFHAVGVMLSIWAPRQGYIRAAPSPFLPVPPISPEYLIDQILCTKANILFCVPSIVELWSSVPGGLEVLKALEYVIWGGGPLNTGIAHRLVSENVNLILLYGATEIGCPLILTDKTRPEGFDWFQFSPYSMPILVEDEDGLYEVVFKETEKHHLSAANTEVDGVRAYATNDLVERHPTNPTLVKVRGRKDDQIMLSTGEKTNPGPLERIMEKNPHISRAIIFGRGRESNGVLIEPRSYDEAAALSLENFRSLIWPSIEEANDYAPAHSKIFKEMIQFASQSKPFLLTVKSTVKRDATLKEYATEIDALYKAVEDSVQSDIPVPNGNSEEGGWTFEEARVYVHDVVHALLKGASEMQDDEDIFGFGCDSLQATYIRNTLNYALRQVTSASNIQRAPTNFVYHNPTIMSLARYVAELSRPNRSPEITNGAYAQANRQQRLQKFVHKYTQNWPTHRASPSREYAPSQGEVVLLTGSTGGLGSQILAQLIEMPMVHRIYAFNRPASKTSMERHRGVFQDRGNDVSLLNSDKIVFVEGDASVEGCRINSDLFLEIQNSVTAIIHNAWRVDFNLQLTSFEPAIRGVRFMVDLALRSPHEDPPRVIFTSSIGVVKAWPDIPPIKEEPLADVSLISSSGYSESKWISEMILEAASRETPLMPVIVRVGQLAGGLNGNWNTREWFPSLIRAGQVVGGLPDSDGLVSFLPLHTAATAIIELRHSPQIFAHLVHPRPVPWRDIIQHISNLLKLPVISYEEWLSRLQSAPMTAETLQNNPAIHLLDFYRACMPPKELKLLQTREVMGLATYETKHTVDNTSCLSAKYLPQLGQQDVDSWMEYWESRGALDH